MIKESFTIIFLFLVISQINVSNAGASSLIEEIQIGNNENEMYNLFGGSELTVRNLEIMKTLWDEDIARYPELPWDIIRRDLVKISLAFQLLQGIQHCLLDARAEEYRLFILNSIKSPNLRVKRRAISVLGIARQDEDISFLSQFAIDENGKYAQEAIQSIGLIGSKLALKELVELRGRVKDNLLRSRLDKKINHLQKFPVTNYAPACKNMQFDEYMESYGNPTQIN